jgi:hypothetical protein
MCIYIVLSIHNDICYIMYIINIMVDTYDDFCGIETQDNWVMIELGDASY